MNVKVEVTEKTDRGDGSSTVIVECNGYEGQERKVQFSRSPFVFDNTMTDEEIIEWVTNNHYYIYL